MKRSRVDKIQKPLTLTLSPQGRGDKADSTPQGRGDKASSCPKRRGGWPVQRVLRPSDLWGDRQGYFLVELIVALILLGAAMSIIVPTLGWMGVQNRLSLQRQEAVQGLHNLMDELTTRPYAELTPEAAGKIELPDALKTQLPGAKLQVEITEREPSAKRIRARLSWNQRNGNPLAPVRVTAWVHEREGEP